MMSCSSCGRHLLQSLAWLSCLVACHLSRADINVEFRPPTQAVDVGQTVEIGVYVVSDSAEDQLMAAAQIIIAWDPGFLRLLGNSQAGATPLLSSGFPASDPYGLNEANPPQDGDAMYVAFANFFEPVHATPTGTLLTTLLFEALSSTPTTSVRILPTGGNPPGHTVIYDGVLPNTDVTGTLHDAAVTIIGEPPLPVVLSLVWADPSGPINPGQTLTVRVQMSNLGMNEAAGFLAFLEFDPVRMSFVSGSYTPAPFGLPVITPISAVDGAIDLASGIDGMQPPTSADAVLAELTFSALTPHCTPEIHFRSHDPSTRITDIQGDPILPLDLIGPRSNCACDFNCDGVLNSQDFFDFLTAFFTFAPRADYNFDAVINSQDFFDFLTCFFNAPPECAG